MTSQATTKGGPLRGVRVLDLSAVVMAPYATQILADFGAEVIVVEPPGGGGNRRMGPGPHSELSGVALNLLRNKRSVCLDLKSAPARRATLCIAATCDVVVTNMRSPALEALRLAYDDLQAVRPDVIYCHARGFRSDSVRADDPAYDDTIQAECGIADATRRVTGSPGLAPTIMADKICGLAIVNAVLAALVNRQATGEGQYVEVPMADVITAFMLVEHGAGAISPALRETAGYQRVLNRERGPQRTLDGWINILPYSTRAYDALFAAGGREDLVGDPRTHASNIISNAESLYRDLRPVVATRTTEAWLEFCREHQIPVGRVVGLDELVSALPLADHPDVGPYRSIPTPYVFHGTPCEAPAPARRAGQDSRRILLEAGLDADEVEWLIAASALPAAGSPPQRDPDLTDKAETPARGEPSDAVRS
jgi:crotonobetainyl-CoA:carnitine CoA-transferase CaiB-like acyl-CoA transferase